MKGGVHTARWSAAQLVRLCAHTASQRRRSRFGARDESVFAARGWARKGRERRKRHDVFGSDLILTAVFAVGEVVQRWKVAHFHT